MTITEKITYLFSKINWGASNLDAEAITIMNTINSDIKTLQDDRDTILENAKTLMAESDDEIKVLKEMYLEEYKHSAWWHDADDEMIEKHEKFKQTLEDE